MHHPRARRRLGGFILALAALVGVLLTAGDPARAERFTSNGLTTSAQPTPATLAVGRAVQITTSVTSQAQRDALIDVEVYDPQGRLVHQRAWDNQRLRASVAASFAFSWTPTRTGSYTVRIGVFDRAWGTLRHWNHDAATFAVSGAPAPTTTTTQPPTTTVAPTTTTQPPTTTVAPTTTTRPPTTTAPPTTTTRPPTTTAPPTGRFATLPVGAQLPSDAECAARVRPTPEVRAANATANRTVGQQNPNAGGLLNRVTGNFTGTTDEIIQWAACKWGFDEDVIRAQTAKESWWFQSAGGDFTSDPSRCAPGHGFGVDGQPGQCAESVGLLQVRYPYHQIAFPWSTSSSAYNMDYALATRRMCFEGLDTWMNTVERGREYVAGDLWGCLGAWFSGRWYTQGANEYIAAVQSYLAQRVWTTPGFVNSN